MSALHIGQLSSSDLVGRARRRRSETHRAFEGSNPKEKNLELEGIVSVLKGYDEYEGGVNCSVCGKLYKSKVCLTKHLWEHSVYWDQFAGEKNHDRVLSIQAALIIYSGFHGNPDLLTSLLVTSPHQPGEKKPTESSNNNTDSHTSSDQQTCHPAGFSTPEKKPKGRTVHRTPSKTRKRGAGSAARSSAASIPLPPSFSLLNTDISPSKSARQM